VGLGKTSVDFVPDCGQTVAIILQPFDTSGLVSAQITSAQIMVSQIPNYCVETISTAEIILPENDASLSGSVYLDSDNDGVFDETESGIEGVLVTLTGTDNSGAAVNVTTTTNSNGYYEFPNLRPGT
jgi:hypothetical protein